MKWWQQELTLFAVAVGFFTRVPVSASIFTDQERLNRASRYFALVGTAIGAICALVYLVAAEIWPVPVAVVLVMITSVVLTGGFHEDGLADTADGFGGGWRVADKLRIMKDSRLGSYGALALVLVLLLKWQLLLTLAQAQSGDMVLALILGHTLSRAVAASLIYSEQYVRDEDGKSKPLAQHQHVNDLWVLILTAVPGLLWLSGTEIFVLVAVLLLTRWLLVIGMRRQIGGYTGDTLGAAQQITELTVYLTLLPLLQA
ncbi:adenosylcobinamide-GDP ribazoletransferase [Shewanella sp. NFH-SH190041]|uniref:adenosylcobinamide-GDP ribazoletransferase n=1 Tax=Shewanella sp. NFH-SH190041 TaxID=2950245 RepID=UPI0021C480DF|nr:adenosylcobinamide-GDP ribazoletransferase [Shewanella sp. NFH-SH190041]BDM65704.1 adenosylcobinamide-GDP ribazoletransferase [Shewanella sp. NFH-SH190041]